MTDRTQSSSAWARQRAYSSSRILVQPRERGRTRSRGLWWAGLYVTFGQPGRFVFRSQSAQAAPRRSGPVRVLGLFCGGSGLPLEVAIGEGAACGQGDGGDGQGEGVAVVEGAGGGDQEGVGLAGGEVACGGAGFVDAAGGLGGSGCGEVDRVGVDGGEDGSQDGDAGKAA